MPLKECPNRHYFNADKYGDTCPVCGVKLQKDKEAGKSQEEIERMLLLPEGQYACGWLVCIEGINQGRTYIIHRGKNFIGSGDDMDIQILGDEKVDRYRHGIVAFEEKTNQTLLLPGESAGIIYLENEALYAPKRLEPYARIEIGNSKLMFIPFCGKEFSWAKTGS